MIWGAKAELDADDAAPVPLAVPPAAEEVPEAADGSVEEAEADSVEEAEADSVDDAATDSVEDAETPLEDADDTAAEEEAPLTIAPDELELAAALVVVGIITPADEQREMPY